MKLDGLWTIEQLEQRAEGLYKKADPNFANWLRSLTVMERRYVLGYFIETATKVRPSLVKETRE